MLRKMLRSLPRTRILPFRLLLIVAALTLLSLLTKDKVIPASRPIPTDIVVVHCAKQLDWLHEFLLNIAGWCEINRIYVYSKCGKESIAKVQTGQLDQILFRNHIVIIQLQLIFVLI